MPGPVTLYAHRLVPMLLAVASCTERERGADRWPEEPLPAVSVSMPDWMGAATLLDSVRHVPAPPIEFAATIEPDREHTQPLLVTVDGESRTLTLAPASMVRRGDPLASLSRTGTPGGTWVAVSPSTGWWRPERYGGESVWSGDTLGTIQSEGWYRAFGRLDHGGPSPARPGDSASIMLPGPDGGAVSGVITAVSTGTFGGTDLSVHFRARPDTVLPSTIVQVTVLPRESLLVVPAAAIASLSFGPAVFVPEDTGVFAVRFIIADSHAGFGVIAHGGLEGRAVVAAGNLELLAAAAEESLSVYRLRRQ